MPRDVAPPEIVALADARAAARRALDWTTADALLAEIQAGGWRVVDSGTMYDLARMAPPDVVEGDVIRYGSSLSVPTRFDEAVAGVASVILVATDWPDDLARAIRAIAAHAPAATQVVVVANDPSDAQAAALAGLDAPGPGDAAAPAAGIEVVWTGIRLGWAAALNAGIRRAAAPVVILLDTSVELVDDLVTELASTLEDATVAVTGPFGLVSTDMRRFEDAPEGSGDVDAIEGYAMAFRRSDYVTRGPLDEHFVFYRNLDIWWSLALRDQAESEADDAPPRRAVRVPSHSVSRHVHRGWTSLPDEERSRASKKNYYRVLKRFATRRDLLVAGRAQGSR
jgi:cysteinyl-tRNA synthetase